MSGNLNIAGTGGDSGSHSSPTETTASRLLRSALLYAEKFHFAVFPCHRDKSPFTKNGFKDATRDFTQIQTWWSHWPNANIGIATGESGIVVLDVDPRHCGDQALEGLEAQHGKLPLTPEVLTGGGGRHLYFKSPEGLVLSSNGKAGPGLDFKASGGYVIAPPSIHESGREYTWEHSARIDEVELADLPGWLNELAGTPAIVCRNGLGPKSHFEVPSKNLMVNETRRCTRLAAPCTHADSILMKSSQPYAPQI